MPKKADANKKSSEKVQKKIIEDKTFGLKNKKGKKQQDFIKSVSHNVRGTTKRDIDNERKNKMDKKAKEEDLKEIRSLFKTVLDKQTIEPGVDPKSVLCELFKKGQCALGDKCRFSHDLNLDGSTGKKDIYCDARELALMDQSELEEMIEKKHGKMNRNSSEKICKYFLDAVEKRLYGWFWICPNGGDSCVYRHALPPGFILKRDKISTVKIQELSIEEIIENEREKLDGELILVTPETFMIWKQDKIKEKQRKFNKNMETKREEIASGKVTSKVFF